MKALLAIQPSGQFLVTQVRAAIFKVVGLEPKINTSSMKHLTWAGGRFERIAAMMYHLRRARTNQKSTSNWLPGVNHMPWRKSKSCSACCPWTPLMSNPWLAAKMEAGVTRRMAARVLAARMMTAREDLGSNQEQNMAAAELPKATSPKAKKPRAKAKAVKTEPGKATKPKNAITVFRKEYYKNTSTYGVRKYEDGKKKGLATTSLYPNSSWTS